MIAEFDKCIRSAGEMVHGLAEYEYGVQYRPGDKHLLADGVSRMRTDGGDDTLLDVEVLCFAVESSSDALSDEQSILGWSDEGVDCSENNAMMPEVLAVEDTDAMSITVK